jgi:hypothetical protein
MKTKLKETIASLQHLLKFMLWVTSKSKVTFHFLTGINRGINATQVTRLAASFMKICNIRPIVVAKLSFITGKVQHYIIDGQHRIYGYSNSKYKSINTYNCTIKYDDINF